MDRRTQNIIAAAVVVLILLSGGIFLLTRPKLKSYYIDKTKVTWNQALSQSTKSGWELVTINNKNKANDLVNFLKTKDVSEVWLSSIHLGNYNHSYVTNIYDGKSVSYTPWFIPEGNTQPDYPHVNSKRFCIKAKVVPEAALKRNHNNTLTLEDVPCGDVLPYVYTKCIKK